MQKIKATYGYLKTNSRVILENDIVGEIVLYPNISIENVKITLLAPDGVRCDYVIDGTIFIDRFIEYDSIKEIEKDKIINYCFYYDYCAINENSNYSRFINGDKVVIKTTDNNLMKGEITEISGCELVLGKDSSIVIDLCQIKSINKDLVVSFNSLSNNFYKDLANKL